MKDPVALARAEEFASISRELRSEESIQPTLERIVELAVQTVPACQYCGISYRRSDGTVDTPASTDPIVEKADTFQYEFGEGPCLETIWSMDLCTIEDLRSETRWPFWSPRAASLGLRSVLSVRVSVPGEVFAGLNLYSRAPRAFDATDTAVASIFARHAADALQVSEERAGLRTALRSRQVIGVAQGMLMQRFGLSLDAAFEVLRRYSQDQNTKLRDLAEQLVLAGSISEDQTGLFDDGPAAPLPARATP